MQNAQTNFVWQRLQFLSFYNLHHEQCTPNKYNKVNYTLYYIFNSFNNVNFSRAFALNAKARVWGNVLESRGCKKNKLHQAFEIQVYESTKNSGFS